MQSDDEWIPGLLLRDARHGAGLTQAEVAEAAGVSVARLSQIENGYQYAKRADAPDGPVRIPVATTPETLAAVAEAAKADPVAVLKAAGYDPAEHVLPRSVDVTGLSPRDIRVVQALVEHLRRSS